MVNEDIDVLEQLDDIHGALTAYYHRHGNVPQSLDTKALTPESGLYGGDSCGGHFSSRRYEDEQLKRYEYTPTPTGYKICTKFNSSWEQIKLNERFYENRYPWAINFQKGLQCFERNFPECKKGTNHDQHRP